MSLVYHESKKKRYNKPGLTLREIRAKKSPCEGWLRFIVGQKRISCRLVIFFTCHLRKCRYRVYWNLLYPYVFLKWFSWKIIHYGWKKPGIIINSLMVASIMQKQKKEKLQNKQLERGWNPPLCLGKCWLNLLSEATFNKTNFWFVFSWFLRDKIIFLISNVHICNGWQFKICWNACSMCIKTN